MMHFWSKFGKPHFIWFWLIARTNSQAQNGVNLDFQAQFDLEDHCQSPHKTIGILIKVFYISDPNLVILAWTVDELSHGQAHDWRTHRHTHIHTHTHTQATTIPEGQNWPRVKRVTVVSCLVTKYISTRIYCTFIIYTWFSAMTLRRARFRVSITVIFLVCISELYRECSNSISMLGSGVSRTEGWLQFS